MALSELTRVANKAVALARKGKVTRAALEGAAAVDSKTASKALKAAVTAGLLRQEGSKRGTFYTATEAK